MPYAYFDSLQIEIGLVNIEELCEVYCEFVIIIYLFTKICGDNVRFRPQLSVLVHFMKEPGSNFGTG